MSTSQITIGPNAAGQTNTYTLVAIPTSPGFVSFEPAITDTVGMVTGAFSLIQQTQVFPGADIWTATVTLPPLTLTEAKAWTSFLMELRGMANVFMVGDPTAEHPCGHPLGLPVCNTAASATANLAGTTTLFTRGWQPNSFRLLLTGDHIQIGYRLHQVLDQVNSDANGDAQITIWPSLREVPPDGEAVVLNNPKGLFRLATNKRKWSVNTAMLTSMSLQIMEVR